MKRGLLFVLFLGAGIVAASLLSSARSEEKKVAKGGAKDAPYVHTVVFYMKKDAPEGALAAAIADTHALLTQIPSVRGLRAGKPAKMSTPDFAVKDYSFALLVLFDDFAGLKEYLDHPKHTEYVNRHVKSFEKVIVYDFEDQKK